MKKKTLVPLIIFLLGVCLVGLIAVSYTHLDVYKRQHKAGDRALKLLGNLLSRYSDEGVACRLGEMCIRDRLTIIHKG